MLKVNHIAIKGRTIIQPGFSDHSYVQIVFAKHIMERLNFRREGTSVGYENFNIIRLIYSIIIVRGLRTTVSRTVRVTRYITRFIVIFLVPLSL